MKPLLFDTKTRKHKAALIVEAAQKDMPFKKDGWQFNWRNLAKTEGAVFFKITLEESPERVEGIMMLTLCMEKCFT